MKVALLLGFCLVFVGCAAPGLALQPTPKPTPTALDVYLAETDPVSESLATGERIVKEQLDAEQKDATLFDNSQWRDTLTKNLRQVRQDYQTLSQAWPPAGSEPYQKALVAAEAHSDQAAALLLTWLDDKDAAKYQQAMQELQAAAAGLEQAQQVLDTLTKQCAAGQVKC